MALFSTVSRTERHRPPRIPATVRLSGSIVISESYMKFGRWMREHEFLLTPFFTFAQRWFAPANGGGGVSGVFRLDIPNRE